VRLLLPRSEQGIGYANPNGLSWGDLFTMCEDHGLWR